MHTITVSIVYATPEKQWLYEQIVPRGTSAYELIELSGIKDHCQAVSELSDEQLRLGIHTQKVGHDHLLENGDRVEIYRPLTADPKEVRRQLALIGKTMGKK